MDTNLNSEADARPPGKDTRARIKERVDANAREKAREIGARAGEKAYEEIKSRI